MHKGYMFSKYALDKDLKDVGGLWSRVDFRDYIITPKKVWLANKWFQAGCFLQRPAKGMRRRRKCIKSADGGKVWVTIYEPVNISKNAPCMVYYHGGAFVLRDRPSTHRLAQVYAESIRCKVVIVHYRLGEPYPIPVKDWYRALVWVAHNAEKLGIDKDRIAVVGDSAGGALAAAVTLLARDKNGPSICFQMLINPVTDRSMSYWSMRQFVDSPGWNANLNRQMWDLYLRSGVFGKPQYAAPMCAPSLENLPPAYVETQEIDCLRDEGNAYADRLAEAGVPVELNEIRGTFNGYDVLFDKNQLVHLSVTRRCLVLKRAFAKMPLTPRS